MSDLAALLHGLLARHLDPGGLNHRGGVGAVTAAAGARPPDQRLAALLPGARSVVVLGNAGGAHWRAFQKYCADNPDFFETTPEPLDTFTARSVREVARD